MCIRDSACSVVLNVNASMWSYDVFCVANVHKKYDYTTGTTTNLLFGKDVYKRQVSGYDGFPMDF